MPYRLNHRSEGKVDLLFDPAHTPTTDQIREIRKALMVFVVRPGTSVHYMEGGLWFKPRTGLGVNLQPFIHEAVKNACGAATYITGNTFP